MPEIIKIGNEKYAIMGNLRLGIKRYDFAPSLNLDSSFDIKYFYKDELVEDASIINKLNDKYLRKFGVVSKNGEIAINRAKKSAKESANPEFSKEYLDSLLKNDLENVLKMYAQERECNYTDPFIDHLREKFMAKNVPYTFGNTRDNHIATAWNKELDDGGFEYEISFKDEDAFLDFSNRFHEILHTLATDCDKDERAVGFNVTSRANAIMYSEVARSQEEGFVEQFLADRCGNDQTRAYRDDAFFMEFCKDIVGYKSIMHSRETHSIENLALKIAVKTNCEPNLLKLMFSQSNFAHMYKYRSYTTKFLGINIARSQYKEAARNLDLMLRESYVKNGINSPEFKLLFDTCKNLCDKHKKFRGRGGTGYLARFLNRSVKAIEHCKRAELGIKVNKVAAKWDFAQKLISDVAHEMKQVLVGNKKIKTAKIDLDLARQEFTTANRVIDGKESLKAIAPKEVRYFDFNKLTKYGVKGMVASKVRYSAARVLAEIRSRADVFGTKGIVANSLRTVRASDKAKAAAEAAFAKSQNTFKR
ncbi:MAG: hypothetical protein LBM38_03690 [Clostridiales bacterium]|nr:hypothetical protein [Clostridiales bacterium]